MTAGRDVQPGREAFIRLILEKSCFERRTERVELAEALWRVTAEPLCSVYDLPNLPSSRMDGIALRYDQLMAEKDHTALWRCGREYVFSNTGVPVAAAYDTVVLIEDVELTSDGGIRLTAFPERKGENIRPVGSTMQKGDLLCPAYTRVTPELMGFLAAGGIRSLSVLAKPRVAILPTGDELVSYTIPLPPGKTTETNGMVLKAKVEAWGGRPCLYPVIPDDPDQMEAALLQASKQSDIVILIAGSSKGQCDYAPGVLEKIGDVLVREVGHGPAKHTSFTLTPAGRPVLGLVGPPRGAELTMDWYVLPLLCRYLGQPVPAPVVVKAQLDGRLKAHVPFSFYAAVELVKAEDGYHAAPLDPFVQSYARCVRACAGVVHIPGGRVFEPGETVEVELRVPSECIRASSALRE